SRLRAAAPFPSGAPGSRPGRLTAQPRRISTEPTASHREDSRVRIALFSWETLHSIAVGVVSVHVTELAAALQRRRHEVHALTRQGPGQGPYECVHGVHYHRCPFPLNPNFVDEVNNMCRAF